MTTYLCKCIGVSKSGYYNYLKNEVIVVNDLSFEQKGEEQWQRN